MVFCVRWLAGWGYVRAPLGAANLNANATQRHRPPKGNLGGFCVGHHALVFVRLAHDRRFVGFLLLWLSTKKKTQNRDRFASTANKRRCI
jgi:hypothetical protein